MDLIVCLTCGRPVAQAIDPGAKVRATCSACQPDPVAMLRFSIALRDARIASNQKVAYCAARVGVTIQGWNKWERGAQLQPPYGRRDRLLSLFEGTRGAPIILEEVAAWPK